MAKIVQVPGVGNVEFPDSMADDDIGRALAQSAQPPEPNPTSHTIQGMETVPGSGEFQPEPGISVPARTNPIVTGSPESTPKSFLRSVLPGVYATFNPQSPEAEGERQAYRDIRNVPHIGAAPDLAKANEAFQRTGMSSLLFAPMGGAPAASAPGFLRGALNEMAINQGRKALTGGVTPLSARKPLPAAVVEEAFQQGAIPAFSTPKTAERVLGAAREKVGEQYSSILDELASRGVLGPNRDALAARLASEADVAAANSLGSSRPDFLRERAQELTGATIPQHHGPPIVIPPKPTANAAGDLGLMQAENIKRQLQFEAQREYDKIARQYTTSGQNKVDLASTMRGEIEAAVARQAHLAPEQAAAFEPVKEQLSNIIAGSNAAQEAAARAARRHAISLPDTVMAAGALAHGPGAGVGAGLLSSFLRPRISSTLASSARAASNMLRPPSPVAFSAVPGEALSALPMATRLQLALDAAKAEQDRQRSGP